jgi:hypothetical protein
MAHVRRVKVIQSGGFAGITRTYEVDAAKLDPVQRRRLDDLVAALQRPAAGVAQDKRQPDRFQFDIEIANSSGSKHYRLAEAEVSAELSALIYWVKKAASVPSRPSNTKP